MDNKLGPTLIVVAVLVIVFLAMWLGWRGRRKRSAGIKPITVLPADLGRTLASAEVFYVATTESGRPLERLAIEGLEFRARASFAVHEAGAVLSIPGEAPVFLPAADLVAAKQATVTIDRVVEKDGLIALSWRIRDLVVDSYLRVIDPVAAGTVLRALGASLPPAASVPSASLPTESEV